MRLLLLSTFLLIYSSVWGQNFEFFSPELDLDLLSEQLEDDIVFKAEKNKENHFKAITEEISLLDSLVTYRFYTSDITDSSKLIKEVYSYDEATNFIEQIDYSYNEDSAAWLPSNFRTMMRDAQGRITSEYFAYWDLESNDWLPSVRYDYTYFFEEDADLETFVQWVWQDGEWQKDIKKEYTYNENNDLSFVQDYIYDSNIEDWINDSRRTYNYNTDNFLENILEEDWDEVNQEWINQFNTEYLLNEMNQFVKRLISIWDGVENDWVLSTRRSYEYDDYQYLSSIEDASFVEDDWFNDLRFEIVNDSNNNNLETIILYWNEDNNDWLENYRNIYAYNSQSQRTFRADFAFNTTTLEWIPLNEWYYEFKEDEINLRKNTRFSWNMTDQSFNLNRIDHYYYTLVDTVPIDTMAMDTTMMDTTMMDTTMMDTTMMDTTMMDTTMMDTTMMDTSTFIPLIPNASSIQLYPNPASDFVNIDKAEQVWVYDVNGHLILQKTLSSQKHHLRLTDLSEGIYWLRLERGDGIIEFKKLLIAR